MDRPNVGKQSKCVSINKLLGSEIESNIESEEKSKKKKCSQRLATIKIYVHTSLRFTRFSQKSSLKFVCELQCESFKINKKQVLISACLQTFGELN